jgi:RNA polymerase sigma factor (sigma-70 family)
LRTPTEAGVMVTMTTTAGETHRAIEAVWRIESAKIIARLTRMVHDVGLAEELAQDALVAALEQWPESGIPDNPGAWLMATAKHRAIDLWRRDKRLELKHQELGRELEAQQEMAVPALHDALDDDIGDDLLRLIFISCHPVLSSEARAALTLRLLGGLTTDEIARAFLISEPTVAQRIVRAKRTLSEAHVPFEIPRKAELASRLASVLEVIYLIFNEGYSATAGSDWMRPTLCEEALRLGRILAELAPQEAEVHGLVALMEIQASRSRARVDSSGEPILLLDQNRAHWDQLLIRRGLAALDRAERLAATQATPAPPAAINPPRGVASRDGAWGGVASRRVPSDNVGPGDVISGSAAPSSAASSAAARLHPADSTIARGPYTLQAALAACHAQARTPEDTDWPRIVSLYDALAERNPSPVVELNRAVAVAMAFGPAAGLEIVDALTAEPSLKNYHLLPSVRGDLLFKLGRTAEAQSEFTRAASLTRNTREQSLLLDRARSCATPPT